METNWQQIVHDLLMVMRMQLMRERGEFDIPAKSAAIAWNQAVNQALHAMVLESRDEPDLYGALIAEGELER